jgi:hypothetical protein
LLICVPITHSCSVGKAVGVLWVGIRIIMYITVIYKIYQVSEESVDEET